MSETPASIQPRIDALDEQVEALKHASVRRGVRKRSENYILGLPLYDIAIGPDPGTDEMRGHACGIIAIGGLTIGVVAVGGGAIGGVAVGGGAFGYDAYGGGALGKYVISGINQLAQPGGH